MAGPGIEQGPLAFESDALPTAQRGRLHRMNTEGSIFTSGENTTFGVMSEKKMILHWKSQIFFFVSALKLAII